MVTGAPLEMAVGGDEEGRWGVRKEVVVVVGGDVR